MKSLVHQRGANTEKVKNHRVSITSPGAGNSCVWTFM